MSEPEGMSEPVQNSTAAPPEARPMDPLDAYAMSQRRRPVPVHRCYECDRPEDEFADCKVCNPELRD